MSVNLLAFVPILSLMMVLHELGHFVTARMAGITVQEFGLGLPPRLWGFNHKGVVYSLNAIPFGAFVKMLGEEDPSAAGSFAGKPGWVRAIVLAAGSAMNFLLAVFAFSLTFMIGIPVPTVDGPVRLNGVAAESPAAQAGLEAGDIVVAFNGASVRDAAQFRELTRENLDRPVSITVRRGESETSTTVVPRSEPPQGQGAIGIVLGVNTQIVKDPPLEAVGKGTDQAVRVVALTFLLPKLLMEGAISPEEGRPIGLPNMARLTAEAVDYAVDTGFWYPLFLLTGIFSAGLAVANMLPIPALDGGRLFFVLLEVIRRRRIPPEREAAFHFAGMIMLLTLMVVISVNDIRDPLPPINWSQR